MRKDNRVVSINEEFVDSYLLRGYDLIGDNGEVEKSATGGKEVSVEEHNKALQQITDLKAEVKVLEDENIRLDKLVKQLREQARPQQQRKG